MGGRPLGRGDRLRVNGESIEIVGVTPPRFTGLAVGESFDVALPFCQPKTPPRRDVFNIAVMGRLKPDWTIERASAHFDAMSAALFDAVAPTGYGAKSIENFKAFKLEARATPSGVSALRSTYDRSLWLLFGITGLVLLIACANLANLMLARAAARDREVAVRLALGASRPAIVRQLLAESALLAALGAAAGVVLAQALSRVLIWALSTEDGAPTLVLHGDWKVLAFTALVAVTTCLIFGVAPALRATRVQATEAARIGSRGSTTDRGRLFAQRVMVVAQIAVSLVLLVGAFLFVRSFHNLMTFDPGIRQAGISVGFFGFIRAKLPPEAINDFQRELLGEVRAVPGIMSAATTTNVPLLGSSWTHGVTVDGVENSAKFTWVSPGYFETVGTPLVQGRDFSTHDTRTSTRVAIVNRTFVRLFVADGNPIGKTLRTGAEPNYPSTVYEIVGVIPDTQYHDLRSEPPAMVFAPDSQFPNMGPWTTMLIRSSLEPAAAAASIKRRLAANHPVVMMEFTSFQSRIRDGLVRERLMAMLSGFFGALAALVAMVGLYGMISYAVAQRRQEIGIRFALGANRGRVVRMVMREAGWLLLAGLAAGGVLSILAARSAGSLLFQLSPDDPRTLLAACGALAAIALLASYLPARRASRLDPLVALRQD
jgi:predicted permease